MRRTDRMRGKNEERRQNVRKPDSMKGEQTE